MFQMLITKFIYNYVIGIGAPPHRNLLQISLKSPNCFKGAIHILKLAFNTKFLPKKKKKEFKNAGGD